MPPEPQIPPATPPTPAMPTPAPSPAPVPALPPTGPQFDPTAFLPQYQQAGYSVYAPGTTLTREQIEADALLKPIFSSVIDGRVSEIGQRIDADVLAASGIPKQTPNEKYYDYTRRVIATLSERAKTTPEITAVKTEYEQTIATLREQNRTGIGENTIRAAVSSLDLNVPAESLDSVREMMINQAMTRPFRLDDKNRVVFQKFGGEDGKTIIDVVDLSDGKPLAVDAYLKQQFSTMLKAPAPTPATGPNARPLPPNTASGTPKSKDELGNQMTAEGFRPGPTFTVEFERRRVLYAIPQ